LEKNPLNTYVSESVIGKIFRSINTEGEYTKCLMLEHKYSIRHEYLLNPLLAKAFRRKDEDVCQHLL
jgi:hypothetical protein